MHTMADVGEIIDYIKSLKRGFDKDLFQSKIDELSYVIDKVGLEYHDFHILFKIWLNLSIPITKWTSLGSCLIPPESVQEKTVEYAFQWILTNYGNQQSFSKIGYLLDWLTAAMDCGCIDMKALDIGYELFYSMMTYETLTPHALKLVYTLTKPSDVARWRVLELFDCAKKREGKKNLYRQLQILLGLFKSYKPECVPENVPAISVHTAFKKINPSLLERFKQCQMRRNLQNREIQHLMWVNPLNSDRGRNKKAEPLVPNMEFFSLGSQQYADKQAQKNYLDFSEPASLVQYRLQHTMSRPARLRALLCNETGLTLLSLAPAEEHAFLSHDLHHLLQSCFMDASPHSDLEKQDLLRRLAALQRTLLQGIPVITTFLAQYIPLWNEKDFFPEILDLVEWVSVDSPDLLGYIVGPLTKIYHRAQPIEQCAILKCLTNMYTNLVFSSSKIRQHFTVADASESNYTIVLPKLAAEITQMGEKALQANPEDMRILYSTCSWLEQAGRAALVRPLSAPAPAPAPAPLVLCLALPLLSVSAMLIEKMATIMIIYKKIFTRMKANNQIDDSMAPQVQTLHRYSVDLLNSLYMDEAFRGRHNGLIFEKLHPQLVEKLGDLVPDVNTRFSIRNHLAFAPYTYSLLEAVDDRDANNKMWYDSVIEQEFVFLSKFLKKTVPELRV